MFRTLSLMRWLGCLALASVFALTACGSDKPPAAAPAPSTVHVPAGMFPKVSATSPPPATPAPPTTIDEKAAVLAGIEEYWRVLNELSQRPVADSPDIAKVTTGTHRSTISSSIAAKLSERHVSRYPSPSVARHTASIKSVELARAQLEVCSVDDSYRYYLESGQITNNAIETSLLVITLIKEDTRWKVANVDRAELTAGVSGCASRS